MQQNSKHRSQTARTKKEKMVLNVSRYRPTDEESAKFKQECISKSLVEGVKGLFVYGSVAIALFFAGKKARSLFPLDLPSSPPFFSDAPPAVPNSILFKYGFRFPLWGTCGSIPFFLSLVVLRLRPKHEI